MNLKIFPYPQNQYSYEINYENEKRLFPDLINSSIKKMNFLKNLCSEITQNENYCYYKFESAWALTYWNYLKELLAENENLLHKFLEAYLGHHKTEITQLIFNANALPKDDTLEDFYDTIEKAIWIKTISREVHKEKEDICSHIPNGCRSAIANYDITTKKTPSGKNNFYIDGMSFPNPDKKFFIFDYLLFDSFQELDESNIEQFKNIGRTKHYEYEHDSNIYIIIIPKATRKAYDVIKQRYGWFTDWTGESGYELLWNCSEIVTRVSESIDKVIPVLKNHYREEKDIKSIVINWLLQFNPSSLKGSKTEKYMNDNNFDYAHLYETILEVVRGHESFTDDDIKKFDRNIGELKEQGYCFFSIKHWEDNNGLQKLLSLTSADRNDRNIITNCVSNLRNATVNGKLCILCDNINSGTQIKDALDFYLNKKGANQEYHEFKENEFTKLLGNFSEVVILSVFDTKSAKENIQSYFTSQIALGNKRINFKSSRTIENFQYEKLGIHHSKRELFNTLINDIDLIRKIFKIGEMYNESLKNLNTTNLILRIKSTPKKRFFIFTAEPNQAELSALFYRRKEHNGY